MSATKRGLTIKKAGDNDNKFLNLYNVEDVLDHFNTKSPTDTSKTYSQVFSNFISNVMKKFLKSMGKHPLKQRKDF